MLLNCRVGEHSWESPLDCEEIQPVNPKGNQSWIFIGKNCCWSWNSNTLATWWKELAHLKRPWCWERLKAGREGDNRGWDGWMTSPTGRTWDWASSGNYWLTGKPGMPTVHGVPKSWTRLSDWTELMHFFVNYLYKTMVKWWVLK